MYTGVLINEELFHVRTRKFKQGSHLFLKQLKNRNRNFDFGRDSTKLARLSLYTSTLVVLGGLLEFAVCIESTNSYIILHDKLSNAKLFIQ
jgi:hypothetical protein